MSSTGGPSNEDGRRLPGNREQGRGQVLVLDGTLYIQRVDFLEDRLARAVLG